MRMRKFLYFASSINSTRIAALLLASAFAATGCSSISQSPLQTSAEETATQASLPPPTSQVPLTIGDGARATYADVVERVAPAVVNISATRRGGAVNAEERNPLLDDPRFREFFDQQNPREQRPPGGGIQRGFGSGVIVSADGTILTNHHVVEGATDIQIDMNDRRTFKARIIGSDEASDLAVLKVEATGLPFLNLGDSDKVRVGDVVLALGNPLGVGQTVTLGIISAKGRRTGAGSGSFEDFLQTDAPINRGNSGGALVNLTGELIGINSQILSTGGGSIGIGFAIPSNMARGVTEQLIKVGKVRRGQLGVEIRDVTSDVISSLNLKVQRGAIVSNVRAGSAAEKAGVKRYDVITAVNGERVEDGNSLRNRIAATQPGSEVTLTINRDGQEQQTKVTLTELNLETAQNQPDNQPKNQTPNAETNSGRLGLGLQPLTPALAKQLQVDAEKGLVITEVDENGPAAEAGIRPQDVILEVNRQQVGSFDEIQVALQKAADRPVLLLINRRGQTVFLTVEQRK